MDGAIRAKGLENAKRAVDTTHVAGSEDDGVLEWTGGVRFCAGRRMGGKAFSGWWRGSTRWGITRGSGTGMGSSFALEPKPNEPRANMYLATVGEVLYLIKPAG